MFKNNFIQVTSNLWKLSCDDFIIRLEYFEREQEYLVDVSCQYINFNEIITAVSPKMAQLKTINLVKNRIDEIVKKLNGIKNEI